MADSGAPKTARPDERLIEDLQASFREMAPRSGSLAIAFYDLLFAKNPALRVMFPEDMTSQRGKLTETLITVIENLRQSEAMKQRLRTLGAKHIGYGARHEHYPVVCECLLEAMRRVSPRWSPTLEADWQRALKLISANMLGQGAPPTS